MTITVQVFGDEEVERALSILRKRFPKEAKRASQAAANRARAEFNRQAVAATTIRLKQLTKRKDGLVGPVLFRSSAGGYGFNISARRVGVEHYATTRFSKRAGFLYQDYAKSQVKTDSRAFKKKYHPKRGIFKRITFRPGLKASKGGVAPKASRASGLVHRLPILKFKGISMSRVWETRADLRKAVTRVGQDALGREVHRRIADLMLRGKL